MIYLYISNIWFFNGFLHFKSDLTSNLNFHLPIMVWILIRFYLFSSDKRRRLSGQAQSLACHDKGTSWPRVEGFLHRFGARVLSHDGNWPETTSWQMFVLKEPNCLPCGARENELRRLGWWNGDFLRNASNSDVFIRHIVQQCREKRSNK